MDPASPASGLSIVGLVLQADPVVKAVMAALALASVACWAVILEKSWTLRGLKRDVAVLADAAQARDGGTAAPAGTGLAAAVLHAGMDEWREGRDPAETLGEHRARIEAAMRDAAGSALHRAAGGLQTLATTGSVAPFVGLFGTVWGIMNAFSNIAASNDTSLAVVAPGIAEALFATAIGLVAAIPAVMAYNRLSTAFAARRRAANAAASRLARALARRPAAAPRRAAAAAE